MKRPTRLPVHGWMFTLAVALCTQSALSMATNPDAVGDGEHDGRAQFGNGYITRRGGSARIASRTQPSTMRSIIRPSTSPRRSR